MSLAVLAEAREGIIDTIRHESPELAFKSSFDIDLQTCQRHVKDMSMYLGGMHVEVYRNAFRSLWEIFHEAHPKLHVRTCTAPVVRNGMLGVPMKPLDESTKGAELIGPSPEACVTNSFHKKLRTLSLIHSYSFLFQKSVKS